MRFSLLALATLLVFAGAAWAVPETVSVRVTDVTTSSFSLVWMTDVAAEPTVELYGDFGMTLPISDGIVITPMPDVNPAVADAARKKGIMKVRVSGLSPGSRYFARSVTRDPADPSNVKYSIPQEVNTAAEVRPYKRAGDTLNGFANDLLAMNVYIRPVANGYPLPGQGDLLVLETAGSPYPLSAFVGSGAVSSEGVMDLNNLLGADLSSLSGTDLTSLPVAGGERIIVHVYRGDSLTSLATLDHYRRLPAPGGEIAVQSPVMGHYADINLDGKVDGQDFALFRGQYLTGPNNGRYNPDYDFFPFANATARTFSPDPASLVDVQDFATFAKEYGRVNVP